MPAYTSVLGLYKPGGGATGAITPDEPLDVDKINGNFDKLDAAVGFGNWTTSTRPIHPFPGQAGYNSTLDIWERWSGSSWVSTLPKYLSAAGLTSTYWTQSDLANGKLDSRYYTQDNLLKDGKLDAKYPSRTGTNVISQPMLPFTACAGTVTINPTLDSGTGNYIGFGGIVFPTGRFSDVPFVVATAVSSDSGGVTAQVNTVTATGGQLVLTRRNNFNTAVNWIAYRSQNS